MDILDFLTEKDDDFYQGTFYPRRPKTTQDEGYAFNYDEVDNNSAMIENVANSLETTAQRYTISTVERFNFNLKGYVVTQDGNLWQIEAKQTKPYKAQKEAFRLWKNPPRTQTILRLIMVENSWGLK